MERSDRSSYIATSEKELLASQGSKYIAVDFNQDALPLIRAFEGKLASSGFALRHHPFAACLRIRPKIKGKGRSGYYAVLRAQLTP